MEPAGSGNNSLGTASMALGVASAALVFGIGLCALVGAQQGWLNVGGTPLFVCGASSAFLGFLGATLGVAGLFGRQRARATAVVGILLGLLGICLFLGVLRALQG